MAGLFDIFSNTNAQDAANAQIAGINAGTTAATNAINTGNQALTSNFTSALQPYLTNYGQAQGGVNSLLTALGIGGSGGAAGAQAIQQQLQNSPGYRFQLNQGNQNVLRNAASTGTLASGATLNALQNQGQGLANTTYQQFVNNLQPFLGQSNTAASGIGGTYTGLGTALNQNQNTLANLGYTANTSIGNANANADLANNAASANMWGALLGGANLLAGGLGGGAGGGLLSGISGLFSGGGNGNQFTNTSSPYSYGAGGYTGAGPFMPSDARVKTDIEPIGELYDGTNVYQFKYRPEIDPSGKTHVGLMAQEVERTNPEAVKEFAGVKFVDYGKATRPAREAKSAFEAFLMAA